MENENEDFIKRGLSKMLDRDEEIDVDEKIERMLKF